MMHTLGLEFDSRHALCIWTILYFSQLPFHVVAHKPGPSSWKVYRSQPVNDKTDKKMAKKNGKKNPHQRRSKKTRKEKNKQCDKIPETCKINTGSVSLSRIWKSTSNETRNAPAGPDAAFNIIANYCRDAIQAQRWRMSHSRLTTMLLLAFWPCRSGGRTLSHTHTATLSVSFPFSSLRWRRFNVFLSLKHTHTASCLLIYSYIQTCLYAFMW